VNKVRIFVHALEGMPEDLKNYSGKTERDIRVQWLVTDKPGGLVGSGPWRVKSCSGNTIVLAPSGKGIQPQGLDEVHLPIIPNGEELARRLGLKADDPQCVHFAPIVTDPKSISALRNNPQVQVIDLPGLSLFYLGFCTDREPFNNQDLRRAVVSSIDVNALAKIGLGTADPAVGPVPPGMKGYDPKIKQDPYNPKTAKSFLEKSRYNTQRPLTFVYINQQSYAKDLAGDVAKQIMGCLGVKVLPNEAPSWEKLVAAVKAMQGDMFLYSWHQREGRVNDPHDFLAALFYSKNIDKTNLTRYSNAKVDGLLASAKPGDPLLEAQQLIVGDAPMAFLSHPKRISALNKGARKVVVLHDGLPQDKLIGAEIVIDI